MRVLCPNMGQSPTRRGIKQNPELKWVPMLDNKPPRILG